MLIINHYFFKLNPIVFGILGNSLAGQNIMYNTISG